MFFATALNHQSNFILRVWLIVPSSLISLWVRLLVSLLLLLMSPVSLRQRYSICSSVRYGKARNSVYSMSNMYCTVRTVCIVKYALYCMNRIYSDSLFFGHPCWFYDFQVRIDFMIWGHPFQPLTGIGDSNTYKNPIESIQYKMTSIIYKYIPYWYHVLHSYRNSVGFWHTNWHFGN